MVAVTPRHVTWVMPDAGPYTFVAADALVLKVREIGRVVGVHTLIATGVNAEGQIDTWDLERLVTPRDSTRRA